MLGGEERGGVAAVSEEIKISTGREVWINKVGIYRCVLKMANVAES